ncbi:MAG: hypothetical protein AAF911_08900 [Planctomycetota bacterium]
MSGSAPEKNAVHESAPTPKSGLGPALLWACFLGCSWTWVIGMFLPIMLVRDFGVWGWIVFAVPNVVGAAAMGFVLRTPGISWRITQAHPAALRWFAGVTIAYQVYVVFWLFGGVWLALLCVLPWLVMDRQRRETIGHWLPAVAVGVAVLSWGCFSMAGQLDGAWLDVKTDEWPARLGDLDWWLLMPGLIVGFALCPYLDPTFHRARYSTGPGTGKAAFGLGFGVVFCSMIVFTLMYAGLLRPLVEGDPDFELAPSWTALLAIHVGVQVAFTLMVHGRERFATAAQQDPGDRRPFAGFGVLMLGALVWAVVSRHAEWTLPTAEGGAMTLGEVGYRLFLLIYGVHFPGYVLICMIPTLRPGIAAKARRKVFWVASSIAYPMAVMGLIVGPSWWLLGLYATLGVGRVAAELLPSADPPARAV